MVLATGATESGLAFPGWTLPGVMGAGCAQTMMNVHRVLPGQRVLMVGSGNVGLIVAYQLLQAGAEVVGVVEALPRVGGYPVHAAKIARAGVPIYTGYSVKQADGDGCVAEVTIWQVDERWRGVPGSEIDPGGGHGRPRRRPLADGRAGLACRLPLPLRPGAWRSRAGALRPHGDDRPGLFVAGDVSGVEEASSAMEEGRLAGLWAAAAVAA